MIGNGKRLVIQLAIAGAVALRAGAAFAQAQEVSAGQPYQTMVDVIFANDDPSMNIPITDVPAGKRVVIESVKAVIYGPKGEKYKVIILTTATGSSANALWHPLQINGEGFDDPEANAHATIFQARDYINMVRDEQGRAARVSIVRSDMNLHHATFVKITLSGYLIDVVQRSSGQ